MPAELFYICLGRLFGEKYEEKESSRICCIRLDSVGLIVLFA